MVTMHKCLLLLILPCICLLLFLLPVFHHLIPVDNLWQADPYLRRRTRVEKACRDFREQIARDEAKRAQTDHPPDPNVLVSPKERFLWCKVPMTMSTSWKTNLLKHSGENAPGTENWNGPRITTLSWLSFQHPAFIIAFLDIKRETTFSHHWQGSIDFNTVRTTGPAGMYFLIHP